MVAAKLFSPRGWETVREKRHDGKWRFSWGVPPSSRREGTPSLGQRIFCIISTDHRLWSSVCIFNWPLNKGPPQLWYWKLCRHKSWGPHLHSKPQMQPHRSLTHCSVFTKSFLTLGSNTEKGSSFLLEFPEYFWNFSCSFFKPFLL